jgi:hypothetical protein
MTAERGSLAGKVALVAGATRGASRRPLLAKRSHRNRWRTTSAKSFATSPTTFAPCTSAGLLRKAGKKTRRGAVAHYYVIAEKALR